jgi:hypothetical protein
MFKIWCNAVGSSTCVIGENNKEIGQVVFKKDTETDRQWDDSLGYFPNGMSVSLSDLEWHIQSPVKDDIMTRNKDVLILWSEVLDDGIDSDFQPVFDGYLYASFSTLHSAMKEIYESKDSAKIIKLRLNKELLYSCETP